MEQGRVLDEDMMLVQTWWLNGIAIKVWHRKQLKVIEQTDIRITFSVTKRGVGVLLTRTRTRKGKW